jgi:DNA helicase HerA-like ATPase
MGPLLLARLMDMSDAQEGVLNIAFKLADDNGLPLLDLKDLRALLNYMAGETESLSAMYGNITKQSLAPRSSAGCWCWSSRAPSISSASRR